MSWEKVIDEVYVPMWRAAVKAHAGLFKGTIVSRPAFAGKLATAMARGQLHDAEQAALFRVRVTATALSTRAALVRLDRADGARPRSSSSSATATRSGLYSELMAVAAGKVTGGQWAARCMELGIEDLALGDGARA